MIAPSIPDSELLKGYVERRAEEPFAELVRRHIDLVYSAASRRLGGDANRAQDVVQSVFVEMSRQAERLAKHPSLVGWLHTTTFHLTQKMLRDDMRRSRRELEAQAMQELQRDHSSEADWQTVRPILDAALQELRETDREAVLLRFFEGRSLRAVGESLGITEDAARMRVQRALERLHEALAGRGVTASVAAISTTLGAHAMEVLPAGLAAQVSLSVVAQAAVVGTAATGSGIFSSVPAAVIAMKTPLVLTCAAVALVAIPLVVQQRRLDAAQSELDALRRSQAAQRVGQLDSGSDPQAAALRKEVAQLRDNLPELERLRAEAQRLKALRDRPERTALTVAQKERAAAEADQQEAEAETELRETRTRMIEGLKHLGLGARIFATDNRNQLPKTFEEFKEILGADTPATRELEKFEFYPQPRPISEAEPQLFLFREKAPRRRPDGTWERAYALADGSVQLLQSPQEDFAAKEVEFGGIATPKKQGPGTSPAVTIP